MIKRVQDQKPYIEVKDAILARSGIYYYTLEEVRAKGHEPTVTKDLYAEYRPPAVIAGAASLFDLVPVPNAEHTSEDITSENFHQHASGIVGGPITVVPMPDGINIGLKGRIAFYTKTAYNYYTAGNKETSADYRSKTVLVDNPEEVGYDLLMTEIVSVNNVAITQRGRGGKDVRVQDTAPVGKVIDNILSRRNNMGILAKLLGVNDQQEKSFSAVVKDSLSRFKGLTGEAQEKEIMGVVDRVSELTASPEREILANVVRDAFIHSDTVLAKWKESEGLIDGLYARCLDADAAVVAGIKDADDKKKAGDADDKKKEKDGGTKDADDKKKEKDGDTKDADKKVQDTAELIDEKLGAFASKLPVMITEGIKKALGEGGAAETGAAVGGVQDSVVESDIDFTSYVENAFGRVGK